MYVTIWIIHYLETIFSRFKMTITVYYVQYLSLIIILNFHTPSFFSLSLFALVLAHIHLLIYLSLCCYPCSGPHTHTLSPSLPLFQPTHTHSVFAPILPPPPPHTHTHRQIIKLNLPTSNWNFWITHHLKIFVTIWKFPRDHTSNYQLNHHMKKLITFRITTHTLPEKINHL